MSLRTSSSVIIASALVVLSAAAAAAQTRLKGVVHTPGNNPLVAHEQVRIEGAGQYTTDDHGEFEFDLAGNLKVGQPARFHVDHVNPAIKVQQWIVTMPCYLQNGRAILPAVGSEPILIVVIPREDQQLRSANEVSRRLFECLIEEAASDFKPIARSEGSNRSSFVEGRPSVVADQAPYGPLYESPSTQAIPKLVEAAYRVAAQEKSSVSSSEGVQGSPLLDQAFLTKKAAELGFTPRELADALDAWAHSVEDSYEKGLAALYEGRYREASSYISASIPSQPGEFLKRYVPLARAEHEQGHYARAESALRKVLAVHSNDPLMLKNLEVVQAAMRSAMSLAQNYYSWKDPHFAVAMSRLPKLKQELDDLQTAVEVAQAKMPAAFQTEFDDCLNGIKTAAFDVTNALAAKDDAQYGDVSALLPISTDYLGSIQTACVGELNQKLNDPDIRVAAIAVNSARTWILNEFNAIDQKAVAKKAAKDIDRAAITIAAVSTSPSGSVVTLSCRVPRQRFTLNPIVGCNIYRSTTSGGPYERVASRVKTFVDRTVSTGRTYFYLTKPVKLAGDESGYSTKFEIKIPYFLFPPPSK